jgi:mRNA interferase RelE/StbE
MKVLFEKSFGRDLKKIKDKRLRKQVQEVIDQVKSAASINDVSNLKKM